MFGAHNLIRAAISLFVVVLVCVSALGWVWVGEHLTPAQALAGRVVLAAGIIAAGGALSMLWRWNPGSGRDPAHGRRS
jgi:drug/metabolite transporter (DMT)-like permease